MKKSLKITALLLLAAMLLPACAQDKTTDPTSDTTPAVTGPTDTTPEETTLDPNDRANHFDKLPADINFNGENVTILFRGTDAYLEGTSGSYWIINDVCGTDNIGDIVSDLVWERNANVAERLNIDLVWVPTNGGDLNGDRNVVRQTVQAATGDYHAMLLTGNTSAGSGINNLFRDINGIPYVDFESPWWWNESIMAYSLDGEHSQFLLGDMLMTNLSQTGVLFFNKNIYEDNFGDPDQMYKTTLDGKLTWDSMYEMVEAAYKDVNGDGKADEEDIFGEMWSVNKNEELSHIVVGCNLDFYERDDDGHLTIKLNDDRTLKAIETLYHHINENPGCYSYGSGPITGNTSNFFTEGHALFFVQRLGSSAGAAFREMEQEFGILPVPKLTEDQDYISYMHESGTVLCVPRSTDDKKFSTVGATFEALCGEAHRTYLNAFLETALKMKYSRDALSGQCIDIVMNTLTSNTLMIYGDYTSSIISSCLFNPIKSNPSGFASAYKKVGPAAQKTWDKFVEKMIAG